MEKHVHLCPWWMGYFLINPIRRFRHHPENILNKYVKSGMKVIDFGCAMGYFSLPIAKMVGRTGKVYCFDIQPKMLEKLKQRAVKKGLEQTIELCLIENAKHQSFVTQADFALLFAVAHEVQNQHELFQQLHAMLKPGAQVLFAEPRGHVSFSGFNDSLNIADRSGFISTDILNISGMYAQLLQKG